MSDIRCDFFGQELAVGDTVIWGTAIGYGRGFEFGTISRFTPKKIEVVTPIKKHWDGKPWSASCYPEQLCKVDPELVTMKLLKGGFYG
jgi:hypothetical protein